MVDAPIPEPPVAPGRCPWCSAALPDAAAATCPSCGATLIGESDTQVPGVNALDAEAILRAARTGGLRQRSRLLSWMGGDDGDDAAAIPPESLAPPPPEVAREMLRLELAAEVADLQGEASTVIAEAEVEAREAGWRPDGPGAAEALVTDTDDSEPTAADAAEGMNGHDPAADPPTSASEPPPHAAEPPRADPSTAPGEPTADTSEARDAGR